MKSNLKTTSDLKLLINSLTEAFADILSKVDNKSSITDAVKTCLLPKL